MPAHRHLEDAWLPPSAWAACADATASIPDGAEVVLAFDGSFNGDTTVRAGCRRWRVLEVAADPFRWARSLQLQDGEGLPVMEYP